MSSLDVSSLEGPEAASVAVLFAEVERLSMAGKTVAAGRVAETGHHRFAGFDSAQKWLADRTKSTVWEAAKTIETARHVGDEALAPTRSALVGGALTATQANEIATAAAKSPGSQSRLLAFARRETASRLKDECRAVAEDFDRDGDASDSADDKVYEELLAAIRGPAPPGPPRRVRRAQAKAKRGCRCGGRVAPRPRSS